MHLVEVTCPKWLKVSETMTVEYICLGDELKGTSRDPKASSGQKETFWSTEIPFNSSPRLRYSPVMVSENFGHFCNDFVWSGIGETLAAHDGTGFGQ